MHGPLLEARGGTPGAAKDGRDARDAAVHELGHELVGVDPLKPRRGHLSQLVPFRLGEAECLPGVVGAAVKLGQGLPVLFQPALTVGLFRDPAEVEESTEVSAVERVSGRACVFEHRFVHVPREDGIKELRRALVEGDSGFIGKVAHADA